MKIRVRLTTSQVSTPGCLHLAEEETIGEGNMVQEKEKKRRQRLPGEEKMQKYEEKCQISTTHSFSTVHSQNTWGRTGNEIEASRGGGFIIDWRQGKDCGAIWSYAEKNSTQIQSLGRNKV